ncbi:MAG: CDP-diacylglycerol--serine O-phosphatidyltransferase [Candidatus Altiarchaeota archaeon]
MKPKNILMQIPDLLTLLNLLMGFTAIVFILQSDPTKAALSILLAVLLDISDGFFSRRLNTSSKFGLELDSLADMASFGIAPGIIAYTVFLKSSGGVMLSALIPLCSAIRLARYNIIDDKNSFTGLPTPAMGGFIASLVLTGITVQTYHVAIWVVLLCALMVSEIPFHRYRRLPTKRFSKPLLLLLLSLIPPFFDIRLIIVPFLTYIILGVVTHFWRIAQTRSKS